MAPTAPPADTPQVGPTVREATTVDLTGPAPGGNGLGGPAQIQVQATADITREYVAGLGAFTPVAPYLEMLPPWIDPVTHDWGYDQYVRMRNDPQLESALQLKIANALAPGLRWTPNLTSDHPDYATSKEIADTVRRAFDVLAVEQRSLEETLGEMALAAAYGYKIAELVWRTDATFRPNQPTWLYERIDTKPMLALGMVVDPFRRVLACVGLRPGQASARSLAEITTALRTPVWTWPDWLIPRQKFGIFSHSMENMDPRGRSIFLACYAAWYSKAQLTVDFLKFLAQFASPSIWGSTDPDSEDEVDLDPTTGAVLVRRTPEEALQAAIAAFKNSTAMAVPPQAVLHLLQTTNDGRAFLGGFGHYDHQMVKAVLWQTLAVEEGDHMARAASETHMDVMGVGNLAFKLWLCANARREFGRPFVVYNYGADAARRFLPKCSLGATELHDFQAHATGVAALATAGFLDPTQYPDYDNFLGGPERDRGEWAARIAADRALLAALQANPAAGAGAGAAPGAAPGGQSQLAQTIGVSTSRQVGRDIGRRMAARTQTDLQGSL